MDSMARNSADPVGVTQRLRDGMADGVLSFPLTSFREDGGLDLDAYRAYLADRLATAPGAVFPACGTGEFFSLDEDEYRQVVTITVEESAGRAPVVAGVGYGWAQATRFARIAEEAGADALLVLPHYLVAAPQDGLVAQAAQAANGALTHTSGRSSSGTRSRLALASATACSSRSASSTSAEIACNAFRSAAVVAADSSAAGAADAADAAGAADAADATAAASADAAAGALAADSGGFAPSFNSQKS